MSLARLQNQIRNRGRVIHKVCELLGRTAMIPAPNRTIRGFLTLLVLRVVHGVERVPVDIKDEVRVTGRDATVDRIAKVKAAAALAAYPGTPGPERARC